MRVDIGGRSDCAVSKPRLNLFQADPLCKQKRGTAMPLRYNYDKPEKPRNTGHQTPYDNLIFR